MRIRTLLIALAVSGPALVPATAGASPEDVIRDCAQDGVIDGSYSESDLRRAERDLPSDVDEYTDCREAIRGELGSKRGDDRPGDRGSGGSGSDGSGGAADPSLVTDSGAVAGSRDDLEALNELTDRRGGPPSVEVGGKPLTPGASSEALGLAGATNELPRSLLSALVLLGLVAATGTGLLIRRRGLPAPLAARLGGVRAPALFRRGKRRGLFRR
jgi:hypothetical protein